MSVSSSGLQSPAKWFYTWWRCLRDPQKYLETFYPNCASLDSSLSEAGIGVGQLDFCWRLRAGWGLELSWKRRQKPCWRFSLTYPHPVKGKAQAQRRVKILIRKWTSLFQGGNCCCFCLFVSICLKYTVKTIPDRIHKTRFSKGGGK